MWQTSSTLSVNLTTGAITQSDPISARASLQITLTGVGSLVAANMKAALYRFDLSNSGTLVATCTTFTGSTSFTGVMSLNTSELIAAFTACEAVRQYEKLRFVLLIYDASQDVYTIYDHIDVSYENSLAGATPGSVSPIASSTTVWGNFKLISGVINIQSVTDGKWYPLTVAGADTTVHGVVGESGVL